MEGVTVEDYQVAIQDSGIRIEIPPVRSGLYLLKVILKDGSAITRKVIIR
jgi:hypothetical protein